MDSLTVSSAALSGLRLIMAVVIALMVMKIVVIFIFRVVIAA